jgi:hypothetical protein
VIWNRRRREASCHFFGTDTSHRFILRYDTSFGTTVEQMSKCQLWPRRCLMCTMCYQCKKNKIMCTLVQALMLCTDRTAHRGSRGISLLFHDHSTRRGWGVSVKHRPLFTPGKTRYPLYRRVGGPQGRSGQVRRISPPPRFDPGPSSP